MKVWKIELPKIPLELNKVDDVAEEILKEEKLEEVIIENVIIENLEESSIKLDSCIFKMLYL